MQEYLSAKGYNEEKIAELLSNESTKNEIAMIIASYEDELRHKGYSRREALQNYIVYKMNVERKKDIFGAK